MENETLFWGAYYLTDVSCVFIFFQYLFVTFKQNKCVNVRQYVLLNCDNAPPPDACLESDESDEFLAAGVHVGEEDDGRLLEGQDGLQQEPEDLYALVDGRGHRVEHTDYVILHAHVAPRQETETRLQLPNELPEDWSWSRSQIWLDDEICKLPPWLSVSVLYKIYDYAKSTIFYTNYMLYEDAIIIWVIRRIVFQSF